MKFAKTNQKSEQIRRNLLYFLFIVPFRSPGMKTTLQRKKKDRNPSSEGRMNTFWKQKDIFCQLITQMGKSYKRWQGWQQFGRTGSIPKAKESILFIQCFLTFSQRPSSQIVHFWVQKKTSKLVKSMDAAIASPEVWDLCRCCHFFSCFFFS